MRENRTIFHVVFFKQYIYSENVKRVGMEKRIKFSLISFI